MGAGDAGETPQRKARGTAGIWEETRLEVKKSDPVLTREGQKTQVWLTGTHLREPQFRAAILFSNPM